MHLTFVTGNENKLREAREILSAYEIINNPLDLPEYQGDPEFIVREKAKLAAATLNQVVFVEDTNLQFNALGGMPGPYIKDFMNKVGNEGLVKMLAAFEDKSARAVTYIGYCEPHKEPYIVKGITEGIIVPARGHSTFGFDPIFQPNSSTLTYAEMSAEEKNTISHRKKAFEQFKLFLEQLQ